MNLKHLFFAALLALSAAPGRNTQTRGKTIRRKTAAGRTPN
jgi:hypothetical protein